MTAPDKPTPSTVPKAPTAAAHPAANTPAKSATTSAVPAHPPSDTAAGKTEQKGTNEPNAAGEPSSADVPIEPELVPPMCDSLKHIVANSANYNYSNDPPDQLAPSEVRADAVHSHGPQSKSWISHFFPSAATLDRLFAYEHMGSYIIDRETGKKFFESMPLYVRVGMHLLFVSGASFMGYKTVESLLQDQSVKQGVIYDQTGPTVVPHIQSFINAYSIPLDELLIQDLTKYPTFNSFFARKLLPTARPIADPTNPAVVVSAADCRLSVFQSVDEAKRLWIKGQQFTIPNLLLGDDTKDTRFQSVLKEKDFAIAVCRLAPQDYHRYHAPFDGVVVDVKDIVGDLYTVNPQAINEDLNVFTLNKRSVMLINAFLGPGKEAIPVAFVAVGAMMVGSIKWSKKPGDIIKKGEELGWFQYGGSTTILVVPSSSGIQFDKDLLATSDQQMETLVRVGMAVARIT